MAECLHTVPKEDEAVDESLKNRRWKVVSQHIACESRGDVAGAIDTFEYATYDVVPLEHTKVEGQELTHPSPGEVEGLLTDLTTAFPDLELLPERVHHADEAVIVEGRTRGTHRAEFMGIAPTGRRIDVRAAVIYRFEGDVLTNETLYFDLATQMRQLGFGSMEL